MNKGDPRIDSDRDHRNDPTSRAGGYGTQQDTGYGSGNTGHGSEYGSGAGAGAGGYSSGTTGGYGSSTNAPGYDDPRSGNAGPHSSSVMNKTDPRVDSNRDHRSDPTSRAG